MEGDVACPGVQYFVYCQMGKGETRKYPKLIGMDPVVKVFERCRGSTGEGECGRGIHPGMWLPERGFDGTSDISCFGSTQRVNWLRVGVR